MTAATPKAVKTVYDSAIKNNITTDQKMQSVLTPTTNNTLSLGTNALKWANIYATTIHGALDGNASSASKLQTSRRITVQNAEYAAGAGSASFNGENDITININGLDASSLKTGTVPLERLPKGALERLVHVPDQAARFNLTTDTVQLGDTVQQDDTKVMYVVVDEAKLNSAAGYQEYAAGTAIQAQRLEPGATIQTNLESENAETFKGDSNITPGVTGILPVKHGGTGTEDGNATATNQGLVPNLPTGDNIDQMFLNGSNEWKKALTEITNGSITTEKLADAAVDLTKLGIDVETIYIGNNKPIDDNIKLWINPDKDIETDFSNIYDQLIQSIKEEITKKYYPVGRMIRSKNQLNPADMYGGTWELSTFHDFQGVYIYTKIKD